MILEIGILLALWGLHILDKYPLSLLLVFFPSVSFSLLLDALVKNYEVFGTNGISYQICTQTDPLLGCTQTETRYLVPRNEIGLALELYSRLLFSDIKYYVFLLGATVSTVRFFTERVKA